MNSNKQNGLKLIRSRPAADQDERCAIGKSITRFRLASGLSRAELAKRMEMTLGGVSAWEYGRTRPDIDSLKKLCAVLGVTSDELLGIEGTYSQLSDEEKSLIDTYRLLPEQERKYMNGIADIMKQTAQTQRVKPVRLVQSAGNKNKRANIVTLPLNPLSICAGDGIFLEDGTESEVITLKYSPELSRCDEVVRVSGHSMEPEYEDGDLVLVKHTDSIDFGQVGIFVVDGEGIIKQYQKDGLHPFNKEFSVIRPGEDAQVRCFGRVLGKVTSDMLAR